MPVTGAFWPGRTGAAEEAEAMAKRYDLRRLAGL